ncbi:MAG: hypothetical protein ACRCX7_07120 [Cetobacterium sp.]|uniref:hypothetical protein n=1 Tax=Cetobacterium sp. TaxID=2071632 RepID=UPI003F2BE145
MIRINTIYNENVSDKYFITTCGKVVSVGHNKRYGNEGYLLLAPTINKKGYYQYRLACKDKSYIQPYAHKLVAYAYIHNPNQHPQVDHLDMNKNHNYVGNLEWVTNSENMRRRIEKSGFNNGASKEFSCEDVWYIRRTHRRWREGKIWCANTKELADKFGVGQKAITSIVNRSTYKHIAEEE